MAQLLPKPARLSAGTALQSLNHARMADWATGLAAIAAELAAWRNLRDTAEPHLTGIESLGFSHTLLRLEAELAWHEECLKTLPVT